MEVDSAAVVKIGVPSTIPFFVLETGPGPGFRDYRGLFRPFWDQPHAAEKRQKYSILQENQALSR